MEVKTVFDACFLFLVIGANGLKSNGVDPDDTVVENLPNLRNCSLVRIKNVSDTENACIERQPWTYPLINCSNLNQNSQFNLSLIPKETCQVLFQISFVPELSTSGLEQFPQLKKLYFRGDRIEFTKDNATAPASNIKTIAITETSLGEIPNSFLRGFPKLERLILSHNNLSQVNSKDFSGIVSLQFLNLEHNALGMSDMSWLKETPKLEALDLRSTQLRRIPDGLHHAKSLKSLDLSDNLIETLGNDKFSGVQTLETLLLSNNKIKTVGRNAFRGVPNLLYIDLTANKLERVQSNIFRHFYGDGMTVNLWENPIHCDATWRWLPEWISKKNNEGSYPDIRLKCFNPAKYHGRRLNTMTVDDFKKEEVAPWEECINRIGAISTTTQITTTVTQSTTTKGFTDEDRQYFKRECPKLCKCYFDVGYTGIDEDHIFYPVVDCSRARFPEAPTDVPHQARSLILAENEIFKFDFAVLAHFSDLRYLNLEHNNIGRVLCSLDYCKMESLTFLSISNNFLADVSSSLMGNFPNLTHIHLHNNVIKKFHLGLFQENRRLRTVFLGPNTLTDPPPDNLLDRQDPSVLVLRELRLKVVPKLVRNKRFMRILDLSDNEITQLKSDDFKGCSALRELSIQNNQIETIGPMAFSHMPALGSLDLSENSLTVINTDVFIGASLFLKHIELWENPFRCDKNLLWLKDWIFMKENQDPTTEIRFRCAQPGRLRGKTSDQLKTIDFKNSDGDYDYEDCSTSGLVYSRKDLAIAIICTILATAAACFLLKRVTSRISKSRSKSFSVAYSGVKKDCGTESLTMNEHQF